MITEKEYTKLWIKVLSLDDYDRTVLFAGIFGRNEGRLNKEFYNDVNELLKRREKK